MAASSKATTIPLKSLPRLSPTAYLHHPPSHTSTSPTFILAMWMNALPRHITFYISSYAHYFPTARIFVLLGRASDIMCLPEVFQKRNLEPVITALRDSTSPMFLHAFSNSGAQQIGLLLRACMEDRGGETLPIKGLILDSTPSRGTFSSAYSTLAAQIPKQWYISLPGRGMVFSYVTAVWLIENVFGKLNVLLQSSEDLLNTDLLEEGMRRRYMYSKEDKLVRWEDIECHAEMARRKGYEVGSEVFEGSEHCQHAKGEGEERYWGIVRELVELGTRDLTDAKIRAKL